MCVCVCVCMQVHVINLIKRSGQLAPAYNEYVCV